jgi:hypothetical protein
MPKAWHAGILGRASSHPRSRRLPGFKIFRPWKSHTFFLNVLFSNGFLNAILSVFFGGFLHVQIFSDRKPTNLVDLPLLRVPDGSSAEGFQSDRPSSTEERVV